MQLIATKWSKTILINHAVETLSKEAQNSKPFNLKIIFCLLKRLLDCLTCINGVWSRGWHARWVIWRWSCRRWWLINWIHIRTSWWNEGRLIISIIHFLSKGYKTLLLIIDLFNEDQVHNAATYAKYFINDCWTQGRYS